MSFPKLTTSRCRSCNRPITELPWPDAFCCACRYGPDNVPATKPWNSIPDPFPENPDAIVLHPTWEPEPAKDDPERNRQREAVRRFLELLTGNNPALLSGQMAHVLAFLTGISQHRTQKQLAEALNISAGRISQILKEIPEELQRLTRLKRRSAKPHARDEGTKKYG